MKTFRQLILCILLLLQITTSTAQSTHLQQVEDSILNVIAEIDNDKLKAWEYLNLTRFFSYSNSARALKYAQTSIDISKRINNPSGVADGLAAITNVYFLDGAPNDTSLKYLKIFEDYVYDIGDSAKLARVFMKYAIYHGRIGQPDIELEYHLKSLYYIRKYKKNPTHEIPVLYNIGVALRRMEQFDKALGYFEEVKSKEHNFHLMNAQVDMQVGEIYWELKALDKAQLHYEKALEVLEKENAISHVIKVYLSLGKIKDTETAYKAAEQYYKKANQLATKYKLPILSTTYGAFANHFYSQKNYSKTIEYGEKYAQLKSSYDTPFQKEEVLEVLYKSYAKLGEYKNAFNTRDNLAVLKDSVRNSEHQIRMSELEAEFQVSEQRNKNQLLKVENTIGQNKLKNTQVISIALLIALLLAAGWSYSTYKIRQQEKQYNEELRTLDETKTRFFSNISHEFKTPLTLIINPISRLIQSNRLNEEDRFLAKSAEQNSLQLLDLTNQVLELTKFEVNKVTTHPIVFNLKQTFNKLYADFESLAYSKKIQFEKKIEVDEALNINLDYTKFTTIIKNLISNALKFTPEDGQVMLQVFEKKDIIEIHIKDSGRGIHASDLPHIFDRYYQAKVINHIQEGGTGIGLAICAEYVKLLGGTLQVQSEYGQGSTFILNIPKIIAPIDAIPNQLFDRKDNINQLANEVLQSKQENSELPHILIVEDNEDMQNYLRLILKDYYQLDIASHGKAALEVLKEKHQDIRLIISDVMMPEMDGYQLLNHLKKDKNYASIPTIMLTALSGTDDKLKALRTGIDDYLTKPFVDQELIVRIDNLVQNREERIAYIQHTDNTAVKETPQEEVNSVDLEWLENLENHINKNLSRTLTADMVAEYLNVSRRTLYSKLKTLTGLTPSRYINEIRYEKARRLIEENQNWTIKAIALKVGFKDEKNFSKNFKKRFGKYPSQYLR